VRVVNFGTMVHSVIILPRLNIRWKMCCLAIEKFYKHKCKLEVEQALKMQTIQAITRTLGRSFHVSAHADTHNIKLFFSILWKVKIIENLR
jgi:hypothetical protein